MQNKNWFFLKKDYENLSTKPSEDLWVRLNQKLNEEENKPVTKFNYLKFAAVFLLFSIASVVFYFYQKIEILDNNSLNNTIIAEKAPTKEIIDFIRVKELNNLESKLSKVDSENKEPTISIESEVKPILNSKLIVQKNKNTKIDSGNLNIKPDLKLINDLPIQLKIAETKYISADELLFTRELNRNDIQKKEKLGILDVEGITKPKSVKILGFTVYSNSSDSN